MNAIRKLTTGESRRYETRPRFIAVGIRSILDIGKALS
jgi:hypothetical protein